MGGGCDPLNVTATDLGEGFYAVNGCGQQAVYGCSHPDNGGGRENLTEAHCSKATRLCLTPGCDAPELGARREFQTAKSCPLDQVSAAPMPEPSPPPDIAQSPERLRLWTDSHRSAQQGHVFVLARGCGAEVAYNCDVSDHGPATVRWLPICVVMPAPDATPAKASP
jgi:hypothetical protein